ncbi:RNA polymerase sigma factor [Verrucomicrobiota bacterium sgz303538]
MPPSAPTASEPDDAELVARVRAGDLDAFAPLVRRHISPIRAFVALKLPVPHLVDEITHETFVFAFRNLEGLELRGSMRAWLRAIAWNLVRKELLRFAREQQNLSRLEKVQVADLAASAAADGANTSDDAALLEECLSTLAPVARKLVEERYQRGLTNEELADVMGRTAEWVRVTLFRVRRQLKECIETKSAGTIYGI